MQSCDDQEWKAFCKEFRRETITAMDTLQPWLIERFGESGNQELRALITAFDQLTPGQHMEQYGLAHELELRKLREDQLREALAKPRTPANIRHLKSLIDPDPLVAKISSITKDTQPAPQENPTIN